MSDTLARLEATIAARKGADPSTSYVASLFAKGRPRIARKLGEEAVEAIVAALAEDKAALTGEAADLIFHLLVLLAETGIPLADVLAELDRREGVSGIAEKAARPPAP
ncbi:phosphoribosyl-ATP diphosphatase [Sphingomonas nostoxanthinifaciens]|uniref:phosphoribosyl-ATP diphosphatase n=1 Tax=Sphingomonas nostoxanthinifaciens TaxID=2872652 RepID=UPI001CC1F64A|nr:phosphoribosyl-ATP diphosphatase [Sphingomonas nostoxanthinifaciens]UAK24074.1 phosphoribosyl-ATP diphosphatase [Sphingomonas nostoxanthinifaciens]